MAGGSKHFGELLAHELGHALGLSHNDHDDNDLMWKSFQSFQDDPSKPKYLLTESQCKEAASKIVNLVQG